MITVGMNVTLGEAFMLLRRRRRYTECQVAEEAGVSLAIVESMERDDTEAVKLSDTIAVAAVYNLFPHIGFVPQPPQLLGLEKQDTDEENNNEQ